jgi:hypothetical protein
MSLWSAKRDGKGNTLCPLSVTRGLEHVRRRETHKSISRNHDIRPLFGFYVTQNGSLLPKFGDTLSVPFSRGLGPIGCLETSTINYVESQKSTDIIYSARKACTYATENCSFTFSKISNIS